MRWADSRHAKEFFAEGVETVRSILEQGMEEGIFAEDIDVPAVALLLYYVMLFSLSTDPNIFQKTGQAALRISAKSLVRTLGHGILSRDAE